MKRLFAIILTVIVSVSFGFKSFAQDADTRTGLTTTAVAINNYFSSYQTTLNNNSNSFIVVCYVNDDGYYDTYFTVDVLKTSAYGVKFTSDINTNQSNRDYVEIKHFQASDTENIEYYQRHELKRDRIVVLSKDNNNGIIILSYTQNYYDSHILN